jgi:cell division protein FtsN
VAQPAAAAKPAHAAATSARTAFAANANASSANAPLSLSPQTAQAAPVPSAPPTRVATNAPVPVAPSASSGGGGYLVQVSSQKNEADAHASYRVLQGKFPGVLGSRSPVIKRADLGEKGVYYRAMVGPFDSPEEASQFCGSLKSAGGQCVVQRN